VSDFLKLNYIHTQGTQGDWK